MANTIAYASAYLKILDEIYKKGAATSILEGNSSLFKAGQTEKSILVKKFTHDALGDYSRASGYVDGDVTISWETHTFAIDRGRRYKLDTMDSVEAYTEIAEIMANVMRTQIVPEIDAYRFAKICSLCGLDVSANLTYDTIVTAIDTGISTLNDAEVPEEGRVMFISNAGYTLLKQSGEFFNVRAGTDINRNIVTFDGMPLITVPTARFKSAFTLLDGTSQGETAGGFTPTQGYKDLNFMILNPSNIAGIVKHYTPKIISPDVNQVSDGYLAMVRLYHDLFILDNKLGGVYTHSKA